METVSIKTAAKTMCEPLTVNRLIKAVINDGEIESVFWPRLLKDKTINSGRKVSIKLDKENLEYLRTLKKMIRAKYNVFASYSMIVCCLLYSFLLFQTSFFVIQLWLPQKRGFSYVS